MAIIHKKHKPRRYVNGKGVVNVVRKKHVHGKGIIDTISPILTNIGPYILAAKKASEVVKNVTDTVKDLNKIKNSIREMRKKKDESNKELRHGSGFRYI